MEILIKQAQRSGYYWIKKEEKYESKFTGFEENYYPWHRLTVKFSDKNRDLLLKSTNVFDYYW